jgi:hypothetical protein
MSKLGRDLIERYEAESGNTGPATVNEMALWAVQKKLFRPRRMDLVAQCAEEISNTMRDITRVDPKGRRYRAKHAVRVREETGVQYTLWADMLSAPHSHMVKSYAQRREGIAGDCDKLATDVAVYNDFFPTRGPIQIVLDFTMDVLERNAARDLKDSA